MKGTGFDLFIKNIQWIIADNKRKDVDKKEFKF